MRALPLVLLSLMLNAAATAPVAAQERRTDPPGAIAWRTPELGSIVRIHSRDGQALQGRLRSIDADAFVLESELGGLFEVPAGEVDSMLARGSRWEDGAVVGAGVVGAAGLLLGLLVAALPCDTGTCNDSGARIVFGTTTLGALSGGVLGALVGSLFDEWEPVPGAGS